MKNKLSLLIILLILFSSNFIIAQDFIGSNILSCSNTVVISKSTKVTDGVLVTGYFNGTLNSSPALVSNLFDGFIAKYSNDLSPIWIKQITGSKAEFIYDIAIGIDGSVYIAGSFLEKIKFSETDSFVITIGTKADGFIAKYSSSGVFLWAKRVGSNEAAQNCTSLDIDPDENIIIGGYFSDSISVGSNYYKNSFGLYLAKMTSSGDFIWTKQVKTKNTTSRINAIKTYSDGYYINGRFMDTVFFDTGNKISNNLTKSDVFLYKTNFDGTGQWLKRTYSDGNTYVGGIARDIYDNIYFTGDFAGTQIQADSTLTFKSNVITNNGINDIFILKYNKTGDLIWAKGYGGTGEEWGRGLSYKDDFIYITGNFSGTLNFGENTLTSTGTGDLDILLGILDKDGNTIRAKSITGTDGDDSGTSLSVDENINAYLGGFFKSSSIVVGENTHINPNPGSDVLLIAKYKPPYSATFTKKINPTCYQDSNGVLIVTPYFGVAPFTYSWSHSASLNDSVAINLPAGTYSVTITDALDSTAFAQYNLTQPNAFAFNGSVITQIEDCWGHADGAINFSVTGGTSPYTYLWNTTNGSGLDIDAEDQTGLTAGSYCGKVTGKNGCFADTTFVITQPTRIKFDGTVVTHIHNLPAPQQGAVNFAVSGGSGTYTTFAWAGPSAYIASTEDISALTVGGTYTVNVTDNKSCTRDTSVTVIDSTQTFSYFKEEDVIHVTCNGLNNGEATVTTIDTIGTLSYKWSHNPSLNSPKATGLSANTYTVKVVDSNSLLDTILASVTITQPTVLSTSITPSPEITCNGYNTGWVDLSVSGGTTPYSYVWSNGTTTQDLVQVIAGNYSVTIKDANNCTESESTTVLQADAMIVDITKTANIDCYGDITAELTAVASGGAGGYSYVWNDPGYQTTSVASDLPAGLFTVTVTDANTCKKTASYSVTQPSKLTATATINNVNCNAGVDGEIALSVSGGTGTKYYYWTTTNGAGIVQGNPNQYTLEAGSYNVKISDANACEIYKDYSVTEPAELLITNEAKTDITTCFGDATGTITITATGGTGTKTYTISPGGTQNNDGVFTGLTADTYTVSITDANNCGPVVSNSITINQPTTINIEETAITHVLCNGSNNGSIDITITGGTVASDYIYNWTTTDGTGLITDASDQTGLSGGTYNLTVTDDNNCSNNTSVVINESTSLIIEDTIITHVSCYGLNNGAIDITATGGTIATVYNYTWTTTNGSGLIADTEDQTGLTAGTYDLTITDDNSCTALASIVISQPDTIVIDSITVVNASTQSATDGSITIYVKGGVGVFNYVLTPGAIENQTGIFRDLATGIYAITITDTTGCGPIISENITVTYTNSVIDISMADKIKIYPNPTSDKIYLEIMDIDTKNYDISIINLIGETLYTEKVKWDGISRKEMDLSGFAKGVYFINITINNQRVSKRIALQ